MSRLDRFLDRVCIFKTRSAAAKAIDAGRVRVDGAAAKRSHAVGPGARIEVREPKRTRTFEVLEVPSGSVSHKETNRYVRVVSDVADDSQ